jgi:hypothetical protein
MMSAANIPNVGAGYGIHNALGRFDTRVYYFTVLAFAIIIQWPGTEPNMGLGAA